MNRFLLAMVLLFAGYAHAQNAPSLKCGITYKGETKPMFWFGMTSTHHSDKSFEYLNVIVNEKSKPGKVEILIVEDTEDDVWDKLVSLVTSADLTDEMRTKVRSLGRSRMTKLYAGLYEDLIHIEHRLGTDPNVYTISCVKLPASAGQFPIE